MPACPQGRAGFRGLGFLSEVAFVGRIFGGAFCLRVVAPKSELWARIGLASLGGKANATP